LGTTRTVLFEAEEEEGIMYGFTENYVKVKTKFSTELVNQLKTVKLTEIDRDGVVKIEVLN
jgi:threonylcarbamoyladenosine tRNA methylthiotransferase MtaB